MKRTIYAVLGLGMMLSLSVAAIAQDRDYNNHPRHDQDDSYHARRDRDDNYRNRPHMDHHRIDQDDRWAWRHDPDQWRTRVSRREWRSFSSWRRHHHHNGDWHSDFSVWINLHPRW